MDKTDYLYFPSGILMLILSVYHTELILKALTLILGVCWTTKFLIKYELDLYESRLWDICNRRRKE